MQDFLALLKSHHIGLLETVMYLARLSLKGFRNWKEALIDVGPGVTLFHGANGQGKSNLLEAVYMLAVAKPVHAAALQEVVNWELARSGGHMQVSGVSLNRSEATHSQIDLDVVPDRQSDVPLIRRSFRVNSIQQQSAAEFVGNVKAVLFEAADIFLVTGSPNVRRRYLDILISQSDRSYLKSVQRYGKVITNRNRLLRAIRDNRSNVKELEFWDDRMAYEGASIINSRRNTVARLSAHTFDIHSTLTAGEGLELNYIPSVAIRGQSLKLTEATDRRDIYEMLLSSLGSLRKKELTTGMSLLGPHRDELGMFLNNRPAGLYASRGQTRSIALALKLSEAAFVKEVSGTVPILALDDVMSELDQGKKRLVLEAIQQYEQVLITAANREDLPKINLEKVAEYEVGGGNVRS